MTLKLPCICPQPGCKTLLQYVAPSVMGDGVEPHFRVCHPGAPVPAVQSKQEAPSE